MNPVTSSELSRTLDYYGCMHHMAACTIPRRSCRRRRTACRLLRTCATHGARTQQCTEGKVHGVEENHVWPRCKLDVHGSEARGPLGPNALTLEQDHDLPGEIRGDRARDRARSMEIVGGRGGWRTSPVGVAAPGEGKGMRTTRYPSGGERFHEPCWLTCRIRQVQPAHTISTERECHGVECALCVCGPAALTKACPSHEQGNAPEATPSSVGAHVSGGSTCGTHGASDQQCA